MLARAAGVDKRSLVKPFIAKRSVVLNGHHTSVSLEEPFWTELRLIAAERNIGVGRLIAQIDTKKQHANLSSALRLFVLAKYYPPKTADTVSSAHAPRRSLSKGTTP